MDLLARRDHSEAELRVKLGRNFTRAEIEDALERARESRWLALPDELAERVALSLHNKHKGYLYISHYLRKKGLPQVAKDSQLEMRKAFAIIENRFASEKRYTREEKQKIARHLSGRGFDDETVRRMIYEEL
jgi:SOS response regulatory protein OraA/RecX